MSVYLGICEVWESVQRVPEPVPAVLHADSRLVPPDLQQGEPSSRFNVIQNGRLSYQCCLETSIFIFPQIVDKIF